MFKTTINFLKYVFGYAVISAEYNSIHYCWTLQEAFEWVKCYDDAVIQ